MLFLCARRAVTSHSKYYFEDGLDARILPCVPQHWSLGWYIGMFSSCTTIAQRLRPSVPTKAPVDPRLQARALQTPRGKVRSGSSLDAFHPQMLVHQARSESDKLRPWPDGPPSSSSQREVSRPPISILRPVRALQPSTAPLHFGLPRPGSRPCACKTDD